MRVEELTGLWTRSLLVTPEGYRDETTEVAWLQGPRLYADLRQPAQKPDFSHVACLADLTMPDCAWLATQQGFAGVFAPDQAFFTWARAIDFQPPGPVADSGRLFWEGEKLVETGRYADYLEHWHRDSAIPRAPCGAQRLQSREDGRAAILVRSGPFFMFARNRAAPLPPVPDLATALAGAENLAAAQNMLDCEISFGTVSAARTWRITRSTLPFCVGGAPDLQAWRILAEEGDIH